MSASYGKLPYVVFIERKEVIMKVMISQPMNGKTEQQIRAEREELIKRIQEDGDTYILFSKIY